MEDDDFLKINLPAIPINIKKLLLISTNNDPNKKNPFDNAFLRIVDLNSDQVTHILKINEEVNSESIILAKIIRSQNGWNIQPICDKLQSLNNLLDELK